MIKVALLFLLVNLGLNAGGTDTTTTTTFQAEVPAGEDEYGNTLYDREVKIDTKNFKVENFWKKFSFDATGENESTFTSLSKTGTVRISVEATSICTQYDELDSRGCSGQKPFLINNTGDIKNLKLNETITLRFQKDYEGSTLLYTSDDDTVFYPLDVERNDKYYKDTGSATSFFSFFGRMFSAFFGDSFFGKFFNYGVVNESDASEDAVDYRQRYIANIMSGIDQDHLMKKMKTELLYEANKATHNDRVSLINYSETTTNPGSCRLFMFKMSSENKFCNFMGGLPFLSMFSASRPDAVYTTDTIQEDTQNSLIALAGKNAEITMTSYKDDVEYFKQSESLIGSFFNAIKCIFFGCSSSITEPATDITYGFTDDNAMTLTMGLADSVNPHVIAGFKTFKLMAIHNIASRERQCKVKYSAGMFGSMFGSKSWEHTFVPSDGDIVQATKTSGFFSGTVSVDNSDVSIEGNQYDTYLDWCDAVASGSVVDDKVFFPIGVMFGGGLSVVESAYINSSKKALLLDLKYIKLTPASDSVTLRYKLVSTK